MNKKGFLALFLVVAISLSAIFVGCKSSVEDGEAIGKVSAKQWEESLSFNFETADSYTVFESYGSPYDESEAQEYGKYELDSTTTYVDVKNSKAYIVTEEKYYRSSTQEIVSSNHYEYLFLQDGVYYSAGKTGADEWYISTITKAIFLTSIEDTYNVLSLNAASFIAMRDMFSYDKDVKAYTFTNGSMEMRLQFLSGGGYGIYEKFSSTERSEGKVYSINKTTVDIPQEVLTAVANYNSAN